MGEVYEDSLFNCVTLIQDGQSKKKEPFLGNSLTFLERKDYVSVFLGSLLLPSSKVENHPAIFKRYRGSSKL